MIVIVLTNCPPSLRGDLSKWLIEIHTGVYVGNPGRRVRDKLWERVKKSVVSGTAIMVSSAQNEQGMVFSALQSEWEPEDFDGITLIRHTAARPKEETSGYVKPVYHFPKRRHIQEKTAFIEIPSEFIILDLETTGLDPEKDEITEIGALKINHMCEVDEFQCYTKIEKSIPPNIESLTHISDQLLEEKGILPQEALYYFAIFRDSLPIVGHNVSFDLAFLKETSARYNMDFVEGESIDTISLARRIVPGIQNYQLRSLLQHFGVKNRLEHSALEDCKSILIMLEKMNEIAQSNGFNSDK